MRSSATCKSAQKAYITRENVLLVIRAEMITAMKRKCTLNERNFLIMGETGCYLLYIYNSVHTLTGQPSNQCTEAATIMHVGGHTRKLGCLFRGSTATLNELCDHNN